MTERQTDKQTNQPSNRPTDADRTGRTELTLPIKKEKKNAYLDNDKAISQYLFLISGRLERSGSGTSII